MGKSSKDKRDIYYRLAKEQGYRARSAFKLIHINETFDILSNVKYVVDLCAAPGSWSQVLRNEIKNQDSKIVSVDLQQMAPIHGVDILKGDITDIKTANNIVEKFDGSKADLVVCDGAPDVTGLHDLDEYLQSQLVISAFNITTHILKHDGTFLAKVFRGKDTDMLCTQLGSLFKDVCVVKPKSSRHSSVESFVLCRHYNPPDGFVPSMKNPHIYSEHWNYDDIDNENRKIFPFYTCGDLSGFDSDMTYPLNSSRERQNLDVIQPPINPAYKHACELRRNGRIPESLL